MSVRLIIFEKNAVILRKVLKMGVKGHFLPLGRPGVDSKGGILYVGRKPVQFATSWAHKMGMVLI